MARRSREVGAAGIRASADAVRALCGRPPTIPEGDFYPGPGEPPQVDTQGSRPPERSILKGLSKASSAKPAAIHDIDFGGDWIASIGGEWMALSCPTRWVERSDRAGSVWCRSK